MKFRATYNPKNDGLPVVNGKKIARRGGRGVRNNTNANANARYRSSSKSSSSSFICQHIRWIMVAVVILTLIVFFDRVQIEDKNQELTTKESASSVVVDTNTVKKEEEAATPIVATPAAATPIVATPIVATPAAVTPIVATPAAVTPAATTSIASSAGRFPNGCTVEQLALATKQLPYGKDCNKFWKDCSFTKATVISAFRQNPILMREFYASQDFKLNTKEHAFFGVVLGRQINDIPVDTLLIGSHDATRFNAEQWNAKVGVSTNLALSPVTVNSVEKRKARVMVVDWGQSNKATLQEAKKSIGYTDDELILETIELDGISVPNSLTDLIRSKMPLINGKVAADQPIHYLEMEGSNGEDIKFLMTLLPGLLREVRYLHFDYNKVGSWKPKYQKLSNLITNLRKEGLVCYWSGKKESDYGLWRITDCFLPHYDSKHWAQIACVNVMHDDVKELATRMENKFMETLKKDHVFNTDQ